MEEKVSKKDVLDFILNGETLISNMQKYTYKINAIIEFTNQKCEQLQIQKWKDLRSELNYYVSKIKEITEQINI